MTKLSYRVATKQDIPFISQTYQENIESLHGVPRDHALWEELLAAKDSVYYVVHGEAPVAWFRLDAEDGALWIGMLQVKPQYHRQGIGRYIVSTAEKIAKEQGFSKLGIHTTEDNAPARALYRSAGYAVTEVGPCTTADGAERVGYTFEKQLET